jgi:hypothetical protein
MSFREVFQHVVAPGARAAPRAQRADGQASSLTGAPAGARQNVRSGTSQGAVARPGGATQHSGGAIENNAHEMGA